MTWLVHHDVKGTVAKRQAAVHIADDDGIPSIARLGGTACARSLAGAEGLAAGLAIGGLEDGPLPAARTHQRHRRLPLGASQRIGWRVCSAIRS